MNVLYLSDMPPSTRQRVERYLAQRDKSERKHRVHDALLNEIASWDHAMDEACEELLEWGERLRCDGGPVL